MPVLVYAIKHNFVVNSIQLFSTPPSVSVISQCFSKVQYLKETVETVLTQPECLELLITNGGSTDDNLLELESMDFRVRIVRSSDLDPIDSINEAFYLARGSYIALVDEGDLYVSGALSRSVHALLIHPEWLMVYGEGEEFDEETDLIRRYPTLPASAGIDGFRSHCFICKPAAVFRRTMGLLLKGFDKQWQNTYALDFWLRAFEAFPHRIAYIPHLQACTRLIKDKMIIGQCAQEVLESSILMARHFDYSDATHLNNYAEELQLARLPEQEGVQIHLQSLFAKAKPFLSIDGATQFRKNWLSGDPPQPRLNDCCSVEPTKEHSESKCFTLYQNRPFGVNLIGHAFEIFGIGEDIRMAARALRAADVPCCVIHHPAANGAACSDRTLEPLICSDPEGGPYAFNLVCMAAPIQARWLRQVGFDPLRERYTISSWPWETQQWPDAWMPLLDVTDELWPSSQFTAAAFAGPAAEAGRPMHVMPMAAEITDPDRFCKAAVRIATRKSYGLPEESVLFGYGFDLNSTAIRKNPMGALEAFQWAFPLPHLPATFGRECTSHPLSEQVSLLIKTFPPQRFSVEWEWLHARAAEDPRIVLVTESLPRDELLSLYGCCDMSLSLHHSEGFERGEAET